MFDFSVTIIRSSRRKTLQISVNNSGQVVVRIPCLFPVYKVNFFIKQSEGWIYKRLVELKKKQYQKPVYDFSVNSRIPYRGVSYPFIISDCCSYSLNLSGSFIMNKDCVQKAHFWFCRWYRKRAKRYFSYRTGYWSEQMHLRYRQVKISSAFKQWGSCSAKNSLNFNWRLILAPDWISDYVIIHELSHILHKNHSAEFWSQVEVFCPNYKSAKKWLADYGFYLEF